MNPNEDIEKINDAMNTENQFLTESITKGLKAMIPVIDQVKDKTEKEQIEKYSKINPLTSVQLKESAKLLKKHIKKTENLELIERINGIDIRKIGYKPKEQTTDKIEPAALSKEFLEDNHILTFGERQKEIARYADELGVWKFDGRSFIERWVQKHIEDKKLINTNLVNETIGHIERETGGAERAIFEKNDNPHLALENGMLNLNTLTLEPFSPDFYALNRLSMKYDPNADCPNFKRFINEILPPQDVEGIQEELGAILRKKYLTKKFSIYLGEPNTGKTTLISVFLKFLGHENVSSVSIQDLGSKNPFQIAPLYGKMANIRDDLSKDVIYSSGKLKELTGGFQMQAERKFQEQFNFTNFAYLIYTCNTLPLLVEDDEGFFDRVIIRMFSNKFGGHEKPDRELINKLTTEEELSGILNWALDGYKRLRDNGFNFTNTVTLDATQENYKRRSDPIWAFVQDLLTEDSDKVVIKEELYQLFKWYSVIKGIPLISKDGFYKTLPSKVNVSSGQRSLRKGDPKKHVFVGIQVNKINLAHLNKENPVPAVPTVTEQGEQSEQGSPNLMVQKLISLFVPELVEIIRINADTYSKYNSLTAENVYDIMKQTDSKSPYRDMEIIEAAIKQAYKEGFLEKKGRGYRYNSEGA